MGGFLFFLRIKLPKKYIAKSPLASRYNKGVFNPKISTMKTVLRAHGKFGLPWNRGASSFRQLHYVILKIIQLIFF